MVRSFTGWSVLVALTAALVTMPAATANAQNKNTNRLTVPITGTAAGVGSVAGNFAISKFEIRDQRLVAVGQLTATVTDATTGAAIRTFVTEMAMPVILYLANGCTRDYSYGVHGAMAWTIEMTGSSFQPATSQILPIAQELLAGVLPLAEHYLPPVPPPCYANCDGGTVPPVLNVLDFNCFLNRFATGCP